MIELNKIKLDTKIAEKEFPSIPGFKIKLAYLSRERLSKLHNDCQVGKMDENGIQYRDLDHEKYIEEYVRAAIKGWQGLTVANLENLMLIDMGDLEPNEEVAYSHDNAVALFRASLQFERWVSESVRNLSIFRN